MEVPQRRIARLAGLMFLFGLVAALFGTVSRSSLVVPGEWTETADNIAASEQLFRFGLASDVACFASIVLLSLALYLLLKPVNQQLAALGLLWRLGEAFILAINSVNAYVVVTLLSGDDYSSALDSSQMDSLTGIFVSVHVIGYNIGMVFFGLGSAVFNYLLLTSNYAPRALAGLGLFSSLAILVSAFIMLTFPDSSPLIQYAPYAPAFVFEVALGSWLLLKGGESPAQVRTHRR